MADFTQIIQEINDDINTNGVGAITGAKLNEVLRDMIAAVNAAKQDPLTIDAAPTEDSTNPVQSGGMYVILSTMFADGCLYGGLVEPNDQPTHGDDHRYFYLAATEGRYTHFNNYEVDGYVVVFSWNENTQNWKYVPLCPNGQAFDDLIENKADKVGGATSGNLAGLAEDGDLTDSGIAASDVATTSDLAGKQDTISDLATIRTGAAAGATAYQKPSTGIPKTDLASGVQTSLGKADTAFQKPSGGIPASDLAAAVQTSLGKADTAVQQVTVGTTTTGNAGTNASVTNGGTATNPVLDFTIPRGADGSDAVNPFKGWYDNSYNLPANPEVGDYAYVKGASASDPAAIYECIAAGTWSDSGRTLGVDNDDINNIYSVLYGDGLSAIPLEQYSSTRLVTQVYSTQDDAIRMSRYWLSNDVDYSCLLIISNVGTIGGGGNTTGAPWGSSADVVHNAILNNPRPYFWLFFRKGDGTGNISADELSLISLQTGGVVDDLADIKDILAKDDYSAYQDCSVSVDTNVANVVDDNLTLQDSQVFESDSGRIYLPTSYSPMGNKTRLIIHCHGASQNYNNGSIFPKTSSLVTVDYLLAKGYAVLDVNGLPGTHSFYATTIGNPIAYRSYVKAYEWAISNFNLYKEIFIIGISAGSVPALQISNIGNIPVLACVTYCGIMDFTRGWMLLGGYHAGSQGPSIKAYLATKFGFTGTQPTLGDIDPCSDEEWKYLVDNVEKFLGWNPYTMGITSTMTMEEYREIVSTIYGDNPPSWIDSNYAFGSVQEMLMAFKIPQRGDLTAYQTAIAQEKKLFDTCSIHRRVPTKIFHATNDDVAPYRYSKYFYEMCKRGGSTVEMRTFSSGGHNPTGNTVTETVNGQNITTNVLSVEALDWLQRFETE